MESAKDRIRRLREAKRSRNRLDLLVPGYEGELAVRYKPLDDNEVKGFSDRISETGAGLGAAKDLVAEAAECILVRENGDLEPLRDDEGPIGFDQGLAEYLDIDAASVKEVVSEVFSPGGSAPLAVMAHANSLMEWMQGNDNAIDKALLGE